MKKACGCGRKEMGVCEELGLHWRERKKQRESELWLWKSEKERKRGRVKKEREMRIETLEKVWWVGIEQSIWLCGLLKRSRWRCENRPKTTPNTDVVTTFVFKIFAFLR